MKGIIDRLEETVSGLLLAIILFIVLGDIASRFLTGRSILWVGEVSVILFMWAIMVGGAAAVRRGGLVSIDTVFLLIPARAQAVMTATVMVLMSVVLIALIYYGWGLVVDYGQTTLPTSGIPIAWKYSAIPVGAGLMLLRTLQVFGGQSYLLWMTRKKVQPKVAESGV